MREASNGLKGLIDSSWNGSVKVLVTNGALFI